MAYIGIDAKKDIRLNATSDLDLTSDSTTIKFGADDDVILTHVHNTGLLLNSTNQLQFGDSGTYIRQSSDSVLNLVADGDMVIDADGVVIGASSTSTVFEATGSKNDQWAGKFTNTNSGGYGVLAVTAGSTSNEKAFEVRKNTSDTAMLIQGDGKVGIGTTSPSTGLSVVTGSANGIELGQDSDASTDSARLFFSTSGGSNAIHSSSGAMRFFTGSTAGSSSGTERLRLGTSEAVFNEDSNDYNFRVETENSVFGLFVDAGNDHVCINTGTDHGGVLNIETTGNGDTVTLACTDTDNATGPVLVLKRAVTGADDDLLGRIRFDGRDNAGNNTTYARLDTQIKGATNGSESAEFTIKHLKGGSEITAISCADDQVTINDDSANIDFRVEGDGDTHLLFVDAGEDRVSIGTSDVTTAAQEGKLKVRNDVDYSSTEFEDNATLILQNENNNNSACIVLHSNNSSGSSKRCGIIGGNINSNISGLGIYGDIGNTTTSTAPDVVISSTGQLLVGKTAANNATKGFSIEQNGGVSCVIESTASGGASQNLLLNREDADGTLILFRQANNNEGTISVSGSTVSYNGFSGTHETSGIADNIAIGTVCSTIDELDTYPEGTPKAGQTRADHAKIKVSDTEGDKRVYGVLQSYSEDGKPLVASVGIGSIRVTGACEGGDLLESNGDGTAKVQSDDIIRSKTIGKVTIGNSSEEVKLVSCVLYCG